MSIDNGTGIIKIDSHQHFWLRERGDYTWLTPELTELYADFLPEQLIDTLSRNHILRTVLVQAAETDAETDYMLSLAASNSFVAGVVGWVDLESDCAIERIQTLSADGKFKGVRPMIQSIADDDWMLLPALESKYRCLVDRDLCFDALVKPQHLNHLCELARRHPDLKIVIDHAAKPNLVSGDIEQWRRDMGEVAKFGNVYCKLSGLVTEAPKGASLDSLGPVMDYLLDIFGAQRLMWGSDWPVLNLGGTYDTWAGFCDVYLATLSIEEQRWIWGRSAQTFYNL